MWNIWNVIEKFLLWLERIIEYLIEYSCRSGTTPNNAAALSKYHLPWCMCLGRSYRVVTGPVFVEVVENSTNSVYLYKLRDIYKQGSKQCPDIVYVKCYSNILPSTFSVVRVPSKSGTHGPLYKIRSQETGYGGLSEIKSADTQSFPRHG